MKMLTVFFFFEKGSHTEKKVKRSESIKCIHSAYVEKIIEILIEKVKIINMKGVVIIYLA